MGETSSLVYSCSTNTFTKLQLCLQIGRNNKLLSRKPQAFTKANCSVLYRKYFPSELWTHYSIFATPLSVHGILQSRIPEWVAIPFSRGSSRQRDQAQVSCIAGRIFTSLFKESSFLGLNPLYFRFLTPPTPALLKCNWWIKLVQI